jgi:hypothetical protein
MRSRFAAFDPAKITSPDLLAGVAGPTVLAAALMEQERREKNDAKKTCKRRHFNYCFICA